MKNRPAEDRTPYITRAVPPEEREGILRMLADVLDRGDFVLGEAVGRFEARFAALCGARCAVGVGSGTDALLLILKGLEIGSGDEVILPPNSFIATAAAVTLAGAKPVLADVGPDYNLDPAAAAAAVTPRTRAILPVHLTGNPVDLDALREIADRHRLALVEDACQAVGAHYRGRPVGSLGTAAAFSLHPLKNLYVWGDGGVVTTGDDTLADAIRLLRNHGLADRDRCVRFGYNSRLDTIQAVVGLHNMERLAGITETRIAHAARYDEGLADLAPRLRIPLRRENDAPVFHTYVVRCREREALRSFLLERGIETKIHYPIPIHLQEAARDLGYRRGDFPEAESQAAEILTLPVGEHLREESIDRAIGAIREFYGA